MRELIQTVMQNLNALAEQNRKLREELYAVQSEKERMKHSLEKQDVIIHKLNRIALKSKKELDYAAKKIEMFKLDLFSLTRDNEFYQQNYKDDPAERIDFEELQNIYQL